jgi:hypothetical protein
VVLSIPDKNSHRTKFADWLELSCIRAADGRVGFGTLVSASDIASEEQPEDIAEEDIREDDLVLAVQDEINQRRRCIGDQDYPFRVDDRGEAIVFTRELTEAGAVYLFCLFLSHASDRTIVPAALAPQVDNPARDLFQVCATVAAAGYVSGNAMCFGWPRPEGEAFLEALHRIYAFFGDGLPHAEPRPAAPEDVKDDGVDVIAWRPTPDGLPGTHYLLGQAASGNNWKDKSIMADANLFHDYWFERRPAARHENAMFMPFCIEPKSADDEGSQQEALVDHMQRLLLKYGTIIYRYRMARYAAEGIRIHALGGFTIERVGELQDVVRWVEGYSQTLRAA